jgi:hypothetical protein
VAQKRNDNIIMYPSLYQSFITFIRVHRVIAAACFYHVCSAVGLQETHFAWLTGISQVGMSLPCQSLGGSGPFMSGSRDELLAQEHGC